MKDINDNITVDLAGELRRPRGRPVSGNAMTASERQRARRARLAASGAHVFTVAIDADVVDALRAFLEFKDETQSSLVNRILRDRLLRKR